MKIRLSLMLAACTLLTGCGSRTEASSSAETASQAARTQTTALTAEPAPAETAAASEPAEQDRSALLHVPEDIGLHDTDGEGSRYAFTYGGAEFSAVYTPDNWKIVDSYRITVHSDMVLICEALRQVHPVHGADLSSYREAEDMAYEWEQHNLAYELLPESSPYRKNAKDVDINPADQGKSVFEHYMDRAG